MKLLSIEKTDSHRFLKSYTLTYENKEGKEKKYEIVSHNTIENTEDLGNKCNGVSMACFRDGKMLLLKEFRLGVNKYIYNLCAGMVEADEDIYDAMSRELYEETGLKIKRVIELLPPSFAAVGVSDIVNQIAFLEVEGEIEDHTSANEEILANFYTKDEVARLIETEKFSARAQVCSYFFTKGLIG